MSEQEIRLSAVVTELAQQNQILVNRAAGLAADLAVANAKIEDLEKHMTCYKIAKLLGVTPTSVYQWKKTGKIPPLRVFQLKELKPEWFRVNGEVK